MLASRNRGCRSGLLCRRAQLVAVSLCVLVLTSPAIADAISLPERLKLLQEAYPGQIASIDKTHVTMANKTTLTIDDGLKKTFEQKLADADIEDMLSQIYPAVGCERGPVVDFDPGRIRNDAFFKAIYGASKKEVAANLVTVDWFGQKLPVNKTLGVDKKLAAVAKELAPKLASLREYLIPSAGTFNWRPIAGTSRLSAHSYGVAVDISTKKSEYWRWAKTSEAPGMLPAPSQKMPKEIIAAFEKQGFIWGGNWFHYDTMHFEYRPELVAIGRLAEQRGCVR
jgi:D-alanyl-D-alanine carboxypeptidase